MPDIQLCDGSPSPYAFHWTHQSDYFKASIDPKGLGEKFKHKRRKPCSIKNYLIHFFSIN